MTVYNPLYNPMRNPLYDPMDKRAGGFDPLTIPDLSLWYDAQDQSTITIETGVSLWENKAADHNNLQQLTPADQPSYGSLNINSHNALGFDGVSDYLIHSVFNTSSNDFTLFLTFRPITVTNASESVFSVDQGGDINDFQIDAADVAQFLCQFNTSDLGDLVQGSTDLVGTNSIVDFRCSVGEATNTLRIGGVQVAQGAYNADLGGALNVILGANRAITMFLEVAIGEVLYYERALDAPEIGQVENYLAKKWDILLNTPATIPDLDIWFDAQDPSTISEDAPGRVDAWTDKSGNGNDVIQVTPANQPTTGVDSINGHNALGFDGALCFMEDADYAPAVDDFTVFFAVRPINVNAISDSILSLDAANANDFQIDAGLQSPEFRGRFSSINLGDDSVESPTNLEGLNTIMNYRMSVGDLTTTLRIDGGAGGRGAYAAGLDNAQILRLGTNRNNLNFLEMALGEMIFYARALDAGEIIQVEEYLSVKWGIAV